jgi:hypothetical protein
MGCTMQIVVVGQWTTVNAGDAHDVRPPDRGRGNPVDNDAANPGWRLNDGATA